MAEGGDVIFPVRVDRSAASATVADLALSATILVNGTDAVLVSGRVDLPLRESGLAAKGSMTISGLGPQHFSRDDGPERRRVRPRVGAAYRHRISEASSVRVDLDAAASAYEGDNPSFGATIGYAVLF